MDKELIDSIVKGVADEMQNVIATIEVDMDEDAEEQSTQGAEARRDGVYDILTAMLDTIEGKIEKVAVSPEAVETLADAACGIVRTMKAARLLD